MNQEEFLTKYADTIKEELNIKEIVGLDDSINIKKIFKPIWSQLSAKYAKDTGKIIQFGKMWNIKQWENNQIIVFDNDWNEWILETGDYEIAYEGLEWDNVAIDNEIVARLDLEITPELAKEWVSREISRFLNQMRKDAEYNVDDKVELFYFTEDSYLAEIMEDFSDFFMDEVLIKNISKNDNPNGNIKSEFTSEGKSLMFALLK